MKRVATVGFIVLVLLTTSFTAQPDAFPGNISLLPGMFIAVDKELTLP